MVDLSMVHETWVVQTLAIMNYFSRGVIFFQNKKGV